MKRKARRKIIVRPIYDSCQFCDKNVTPDYKDPELLKGFMNDRARILSRERSNVCYRHQKALGVAVKRARFLGLLPYVEAI